MPHDDLQCKKIHKLEHGCLSDATFQSWASMCDGLKVCGLLPETENNNKILSTNIKIHTFQFSYYTGQFIILSQLESDMVESTDSFRSQLLSFHWGMLSNWTLLTLCGKGKTLQDVFALKGAMGGVLHNYPWIVLRVTLQETLKFGLLSTKYKEKCQDSIILGKDICI